ncbi:hypothetical protein CMQ_4649 [Grosmannia clavigera kw1407]|uniref:Uncharacterized protein n=1 Tax=Grosmannia clavigera (strain kw1407 / UAMH 11150) TaxID=655863 RepID=F0XUW9_GROCL|nr:uncharacterized protein CMQ_4649 [Grosmannia clavigera kw1407]EFW98797.1 hypothetical protein CMQ_4649 [Grosmannia clavigera kw1407]
MPRFPSAFSRRKSSVDNVDRAATAGPSFRVLDRSEVTGSPKSPNSDHLTVRRPVKSRTIPSSLAEATLEEDNIFSDLKTNRGSGSSNTIKTISTDNSSRHSNASTAPSSADFSAQNQHQVYQAYQPYQHQEDWRHSSGQAPPPIPKSSSSSFLRSAGRTFSFGGQKKAQSIAPSYDERSQVSTPPDRSGRERAATASTTSTATPPRVDEDFNLDLGGDFSKMLGLDKRASQMTVREDGPERPALAPRSLTGNRLNQPQPMQLDVASKIEPSPLSWGSHHSNDQLLQPISARASPTNENVPPVPRHALQYGNRSDKTETAAPIPVSSSAPAPPSADSNLKRSSAVFGRRRSNAEFPPEAEVEAEDDDADLLKDSFSTVSKFLNGAHATSAIAKSSATVSNRFSGYRQVPTGSEAPHELNTHIEEDNMFDTPLTPVSQAASRPPVRPLSPTQNKVMTPAEFERYRKDKERETRRSAVLTKADGTLAIEDADNYDEDEFEDEAEKLKEAAKQRRKQEAHMAVYRQQMMKVTGETSSGSAARPPMQSFSSPSLLGVGSSNSLAGPGPLQQAGSDVSDDEEVPLAILAAHGFPNKNRPPVRLTTMMSNPNLRAAATPSFQRPGTAAGDAQSGGAVNGRLPPFARNLPQDPYGLVSPPVRETLQFSGGAPAVLPRPSSPLPHGGLVGVIANEERSRALRRGNQHVEGANKPMPNMMTGVQFDPAGVPQHMMYPATAQPQVLSPGDQAQIQMTQQMQQFMQMQMQFMQMMANGGNAMPQQRPESHYSNASGMNPMMGGAGMGMGGPDMMRQPSFMDNGPMADMTGQQHADPQHMRTMSMVQPSSASWIQPLALNSGLAPSIRLQGANGYAPSIAPSERSNVGLPGRYRPVSHMASASQPIDMPKPLTVPGTLGVGAADGIASESSTPGTASPAGWDQSRKHINRSPLNNSSTADGDDDDDEEGWAAMKAEREKKISLWKTKKTLGSDIGALII